MTDKSQLIYVTPKVMERSKIEENFASGDKKKITDSILSVASYDDDWRYAERWCLHFLESCDPDIAIVAAIGIAEIDRAHQSLNYNEVAEALHNRMLRSDVSEDLLIRINLTLKDIRS